LKDPLPEEKSFFSKIRYAGSIQIIGTTKTDLVLKSPFIWTVPKENPNFSALSFKPWHIPSADAVVFHISLKEFAYRRLLAAGEFDREHLQNLIQEEFPSLSDVSIIDMQIWESATPKAYPGYLTSVVDFQRRPNWNNGIHFCGDYLESASTEGALTSSIKLLEKINAVQILK
jgi:predicted NAD/FAD-dependent oxidoreductase